MNIKARHLASLKNKKKEIANREDINSFNEKNFVLNIDNNVLSDKRNKNTNNQNLNYPPTNNEDNEKNEFNMDRYIKNLLNCVKDSQSFYLAKQFFEISADNKKTETLNDLISGYLIQKKINIREVEVKLRNEEIRKEKEELKVRKNLENKIDDALEKANLCLSNMKSFGKINPIIQTKNDKNIRFKDLEKKDDKDPIEIIKGKIKNKFNEKISLEEIHMNDYFFNVTKIRNNIKMLKQKNKNFLARCKNLKNIYSQMYTRSKKIWKTDNTTDFTFYKMLNFKYVDLLYKLISIIGTELFQKLFIKIIYFEEEKLILYNNNTTNSNQQDYISRLQDTFSFWYCLKFLLNLIQNNPSLTNLTIIFYPINENALISNENFVNNQQNIVVRYRNSDLFGYVEYIKAIYFSKSDKNIFLNMNNILEENITKYLKFLNEKMSKKNNKNVEENQILDGNYYTFYEHVLLNFKINFLKLTFKNMNKDQNYKNMILNQGEKDTIKYLPKETMKKVKDLYSIINNNSNYSFSIFKK